MIVLKFGGTSLQDATAIARCCEIVRSRVERTPVVVASAMAKVTDALLEASALAADGNREGALKRFCKLQERHQATARELLRNPDPALAAINSLFDELRPLLTALCALHELTPRLSDRITSFGERLSTVLFSAALQELEGNAELVDARECIITDDQFTCAMPLLEESNLQTRARLLPLLQKKLVPVLGGFIASNGKGVTTTLGRGGSDFSAALIAAALGAEALEIWTDVDGVRTTDPRLCPEAKPITELNYREAAELAHLGAKVLHPATLLPAIESDIPVYVLNSHNPEHPGTRIARGNECPTRVKAIALKRGIIMVEASTARSLRHNGLAREVFSLLEEHGCTPDVASITDTHVTVAIDKKNLVPVVSRGLGSHIHVHAENSKALISLVADGIRKIPSLPTTVFSALAGLHVHMISQGASQCSFSLVLDEVDAPQAVQRLHEALI